MFLLRLVNGVTVAAVSLISRPSNSPLRGFDQRIRWWWRGRSMPVKLSVFGSCSPRGRLFRFGCAGRVGNQGASPIPVMGFDRCKSTMEGIWTYPRANSSGI